MLLEKEIYIKLIKLIRIYCVFSWGELAWMNIGMSNSVEEITLSSSFTWRQLFSDNSGFYDVLILGKYCGVSVWWPGPWRWWTTRPLVWSTGWGGRCRNFSNFSCNGREAWNRSPSSTNRKSYFHWKSYIVQDFSNYVWLGIGISVLIPKLTWCRSRRRSSLSPRQGRGLGPGEAGPAPGWPDRA